MLNQEFSDEVQDVGLENWLVIPFLALSYSKYSCLDILSWSNLGQYLLTNI